MKECYSTVPPGLYKEVWKHPQEMIDVRAICLSNSPWASTIALVRKKNGKLHFCINLQKLNSLMVKDVYSIPRIQDTLDCLQGAIWLTMLDLKSRYWQVKLEEASKALTAFMVGSLRFFECECMSFRLKNVPATFQYLMETCFGDLQFQWCIIYLMTSLFFAVTLKEYLKRLHAVLSWLQEAGLKLQPAKCEFFKTSVVYLGHEI